MSLEKNIILCGFMGCGKTTVGKILAQMLKADFIDMDDYIEAREGQSIPEIFALYGEPGFRERERAASAELSLKRGTVIAAGGGALLFKHNEDTLRQGGIIVFLDCGFEACYSRISSSGRPLVRANSKEALKALYDERRTSYLAVSDFTLSSGADAPQRARAVYERLTTDTSTQD